MKATDLELKAIEAMTEIFGNKYSLPAPERFMVHEAGYLTSFKLSNGEEYLVKVYDDRSKPKVFKLLISKPDGTNNRISAIETAHLRDGYITHHQYIDAAVVEEMGACKKCGGGQRYIGLRKDESFVAISHCDGCGNEYEF